MIYLLSAEYEQYGLDATTPDFWIAAASAMIEAHCRRPALGVAEYTERQRVPIGRNTVRLTYLPLQALAPATSAMIAARGRFGQPRKGEGIHADLTHDVARAFSLPGTWTSLDVTQFDLDAHTGEVTFPGYALGLPFNEVEVTYTAGLDPIADELKFACAQIVRNAQAIPSLNVRSGTVDKLRLEYFADSLVDPSVKTMLAPYVAQKVA
jgi:hypothetical protein